MLQIFSTNTYKREFILIFGIQQNPCQSALSTSLSGRFALLLVWSINTHPTVYGPLQTLTLMIRDLKHDISCSCRTKGMRVQWGHITDRSPLSKKKKAFCDGVCIFIPFYDRSSSTAVDRSRTCHHEPMKIRLNLKTYRHHLHMRPQLSYRQIPQPQHRPPCQQHWKQLTWTCKTLIQQLGFSIMQTSGRAHFVLLSCAYCIVTCW